MNPPYTLQDVDTADHRAVAEAVAGLERDLYPEADGEYIHKVFDEVAGMFAGNFARYQAMDTVYHNLEHTMQATLCWARICRNFQRERQSHWINRRAFRIGMVSVLLHDIGYLKEAGDEHGTGAKYTFVHEKRSCEMAQICLASNGWEQSDIFTVQHIISCTGPRASIDNVPFRNRSERILGQMVCTADYLGQMSDPQYVAKLPVLFQEFEESDDFRGIDKDKRYFKSLDELLRKTPEFWINAVLPKLENECGGMYRFLSEPYIDGLNPYVMEVENNIAKIRRMLGQN